MVKYAEWDNDNMKKEHILKGLTGENLREIHWISLLPNVYQLPAPIFVLCTMYGF